METLRDRFEEAKAAAWKALEQQKASPSAEAIREAAALAGQAAELGAQLKQAEVDEKSLERLNELGGREPISDDGRPLAAGGGQGDGFLPFGGAALKTAAGQVASKMTGPGVKELLPVGAVVTPIPLSPSSPVELGRPATSLFDTLPAARADPTYRYLRQTQRTVGAAPVASGAAKPTTTLGLEPVEARLHVIAHVSEPVDSYWLRDSELLQSFVSTELLYGLRVAVEGQVIGGDGTGENLTGLAHVDGVQQQAFTADPVSTSRRALTLVEDAGYTGSFFALSPSDWEAVELAPWPAGTGFMLGQGEPVDRASRRLWGTPVAVSSAVPAGTGWLVSQGVVAVRSDAAIRVDWSEATNDDFSHNLMRCRVEGRFNLDCYQPAGVVQIALAA